MHRSTPFRVPYIASVKSDAGDEFEAPASQPRNCYEPAQPDMTRDHYNPTSRSTLEFLYPSIPCNLHDPADRNRTHAWNRT